MKDELDELLVKSFPNLYAQRNGDLRTTAMCWGFETGSGWFRIIYELSTDLEAEILKLPEADREYCCASQVKEKYGTLRFYMHSQTEEMSNLIREAQHKSHKTCETCGAPGELRGGGWLFTACEEHSRDELTCKEYGKQEINKEWSKFTLKEKIVDYWKNYINFYFITRWFKYPKYCIQDIQNDLKWKWWKLKRYVKRRYKP